MPPADTRSSKAVIEDYVAALQRSDADAIRDSFAEDAEWCLTGELPRSGTWRGRDVIFNDFLSRALASYEEGSITFEVTRLIGEGDDVALEWITRGRSQSGAPYENHYLGLFTVRDQKIASIREYLASARAAHELFAA